MLITNPNDYRRGDLVLFDGAGAAFRILSWLLARFDPSWRKLRKELQKKKREPPWHTAFLSRKIIGSKILDPPYGWLVSEAKGGVGITESPLSEFKEPYIVFRWFEVRPGEAEVNTFIDEYRGEKYDAFWGYLFVIVWYFWKWWPLIIDHNWMCWEWLWFFADRFGKPIDNVHKYPLITILMDKVGYPGY